MWDSEGAADNVALITFSAYPQLLCPFTLDVDAVTGFLKGLKPVDNRAEDGTAIGVGLAKADAALKGSQARSRIVILLTDGENNIDLITPEEASRLAAEEHIRSTRSSPALRLRAGHVRQPAPTERQIPPATAAIAQATGRRFYRAQPRGLEDLRRIGSSSAPSASAPLHPDLRPLPALPGAGAGATSGLALGASLRRLP
jgi:Mg-chelatase subunit ChlD